MTRWPHVTESTTRQILAQIESLGYAVSAHIMLDEYVEMHAVNAADPAEQHIARCLDGNGIEELYRVACLLAEIMKIELME
jgi:archaellum biogenesis ATPase FlaH